MNDSLTYQGEELALFSEAHNWKRYIANKLRPHLGQRVLEVGAGLGATTQTLCTGREALWVSLEPDDKLFSQLKNKAENKQLPPSCQIVQGTLQTLSATIGNFDTILYVDVLEHIEDVSKELEHANSRLTENGRVIALCPAHPWLYTPFDAAIGHFRRYNRQTYHDETPADLELVSSYYLDSVGLLASLGNRFVLQSSYPSIKQIRIWDRMMIPLSRILDKILFNSIGKSVVGIWSKKR